MYIIRRLFIQYTQNPYCNKLNICTAKKTETKDTAAASYCIEFIDLFPACKFA